MPQKASEHRFILDIEYHQADAEEGDNMIGNIRLNVSVQIDLILINMPLCMVVDTCRQAVSVQ